MVPCLACCRLGWLFTCRARFSLPPVSATVGPPSADPTSTLIRKPTTTRKTSLAKRTWWHSRSPGQWSPCAKDSVPTRPGENQSLSLSLLLEDADRSATSELGGSRPRYTFDGCPTHRNAYVASRATRACSRVGCPRAKTHVREGIPLCDEHLRPSVTWHDKPPAVPPTRTRSPSPGRMAPAAELPEDLGPASSQAWLRWSEPSQLAAQAYFAFDFQLMGRATDSTRQNPRTSIYIPDLDLTFSVPSDLAAGGINAGQAEQMALSRALVIVDPPWNGKPGHNQHGDPFLYAAAQSLTRGEFTEGYAVHHLGRVPPSDEQPQPATPRASSCDPGHPTAGSGTPRASTDPTAPDLQALGEYMSARLSGRSAQDALDISALEGQAPGDARQSLSRAAAWYQDHHASPQDPAAAAALIELLDPVAHLQALGSRKVAVSPPAPPVGQVPGPPTASFGRSRSPSPTPRNTAAMFLQDEHADQTGAGICVRQRGVRYPRGSTTFLDPSSTSTLGSGHPRNGPSAGPLRWSVL